MDETQRNVFGEPIEVCSARPLTGFYRTGCCETGTEDEGIHTVCIEATAAFLAFSKARGNGPLRARLVDRSDRSQPFSLDVPEDFRFCPWGSFC